MDQEGGAAVVPPRGQRADRARAAGGAVPVLRQGADQVRAATTSRRSRAAGVRVVPPAVARRGAYIAPNVVLMPSYVNIGAYVDEGTMVDTWATVGLVRADRPQRAPFGRRRHRRRAGAAAGQPHHHRGQLLHRRALGGRRRRDRRGELGAGHGRVHRPEHARSTTGRPARSATAACPPGSVVVAGSLPSARRQLHTCTARSSSSRSMRRRAPRPASTSLLRATDRSARKPNTGPDVRFHQDRRRDRRHARSPAGSPPSCSTS